MSANYSWAGSVNGDWSTASCWTGGVPNDPTAVVAIALPGTYAVAIAASESFSVGTLAFSATGAVLQLGGALTVAQTLTLTAGSIYLSGAINGGAIIAGSGGRILFQNGTLNGVTYQGTLDLSGGTYQPTVTITGGLVVTGAGGVGPGTIQDTSPSGSKIVFNNTQTIDNATINIGSPSITTDSLFENNTTSTNQILTLGPNLVINQVGKFAQGGTLGNVGGAIVNLGTIDAQYAGGHFIISGWGFINQGTINVSGETVFAQNFTNAAGGTVSIAAGSTFYVTGAFANSGAISVASGGLIDFQAATTITTAQLGVISAAPNTVEIDGTLDNTAATLGVGTGTALGQMVLQGTITGGTITDAGAGFLFTGGTLNNVTYQGTIDLSSIKYLPTLFISGGITVTGPGGSGPGTILVTGRNSRLAFDNTETIDNVTINLGNSLFGASLIENDTTGTGQTLTFGPNATLDVLGYVAMIGASGSANDTIVNQGTIEIATSGSSLFITAPNFVNQGKMIVLASQALSIQNFTNSAGGVLSVSAGSTVTFNGSFANSGTINVVRGGVVTFQQSTTISTAQLGKFRFNGGTVQIYGTLNNAGSTLTIGPTAGVSTLAVINGIVNGGTIIDGGSGAQFQFATLNGVTYQGTIDMSSKAFQPYLNIAGGLAMTGAGGTGPGTIQLTGNASTLVFLNSQTFDNATINIGTYATTDSIIENDTTGAGQTLTLGANLVIYQAGFNAQITTSGSSSDLIVNNGTIIAGSGLSKFTISAANFTNAGKIIVKSSDTLYLQPGNLTNLSGGVLTGGYFEADFQSTIELAQNQTIVTDNASIVLSSATSTIRSYNTATMTEVTIDTTLTSIGASGSLALLSGRNFTTGLFTVAGQLVLGGGTFTSTGLTIASGGSVKGWGAIAAPIINGGLIEASGGSLYVQQDVTGSGAFQVDAASALVLLGPSVVAETVRFNGSGATLRFESPSAFAGAIAGFGAGDLIDLLKTTATGVALNAANQLVLTNNGSVVTTIQLGAGAAGFNYYVSPDGHGGTYVGAGNNAPPVVTVPAAQFLQAGQTLAITGIRVSDSDAGSYNETITATITDTSGLLSVTASPGATVSGSGAASLTLSGTLAAVNAELATLTFSAPAAGAATDTITLALNDGRGGSGTAAIAVSINQPVATTAPSVLTLTAGSPAAVAGLSVADADAASAGETATVVLSDSVGLLSATVAAGASVTGAGTNSLTLSGTLSAVDAELASLTYAAASGTAQTSDVIDVATNDGRGSSDDHKIAVTLNQPITLTGPTGVVFAAGVNNPINGVSLADSDAASAGETITVTISDSIGLLSATSTGGGDTMTGSGTTSLTITGSLGQVNADLATLVYNGTPGSSPTGIDLINVLASDGRGGNSDQTIAVAIVGASSAWKRAMSGDWGNAALWTAGVPSSPNGDAFVALGGAYTVGLGAGESFTVRNLTLSNGRGIFDFAGSLTSTGSLTLAAGSIVLDNGGVLNGVTALSLKTSISGTGTLNGPVLNLGTITATGGLLKITGAVGLIGSLGINSNATLELAAVAIGQTITFAAGGVNQVLKLDAPTGMFGRISGFGAGATIDLANLSVTSDKYSAGVLALYSGATLVGGLVVSGAFGGQTFALSSDGNGGTDITLVANAAPTISAPTTLTMTAGSVSPVAGISVSDTDAAASNETLTVVLTDTAGRLSATNSAGGTVTGATTAKLTIVGTLAQVDGDLATLTDRIGKAGADTITITASDGNGGIAAPATIGVTAAAALRIYSVSTAGSSSPDLLTQYVAAGFGSNGSGTAISVTETQALVKYSELAVSHH